MFLRARYFLAGLCLLLILPRSAHGILVVDENEQLIEPGGFVDTEVINYGHIAGSKSDKFVFGPNTLVRGTGSYEHVVNLGVFAPGNSPSITTGTNTTIGGTIEIELGGTMPGFGSGRHDQFNDGGTLTLGANSVLEVLTFESFLPTPGDTFEILSWQTELSGSFESLVVDSFFTDNSITFQQVITSPSGEGNITLIAVAIPEPGAFWLVGAVAAMALQNARLQQE